LLTTRTSFLLPAACPKNQTTTTISTQVVKALHTWQPTLDSPLSPVSVPTLQKSPFCRPLPVPQVPTIVEMRNVGLYCPLLLTFPLTPTPNHRHGHPTTLIPLVGPDLPHCWPLVLTSPLALTPHHRHGHPAYSVPLVVLDPLSPVSNPPLTTRSAFPVLTPMTQPLVSYVTRGPVPTPPPLLTLTRPNLTSPHLSLYFCPSSDNMKPVSLPLSFFLLFVCCITQCFRVLYMYV